MEGGRKKKGWEKVEGKREKGEGRRERKRTFINIFLHQFLRPIITLAIQPKTLCPCPITPERRMKDSRYALCVPRRAQGGERAEDPTDERGVVVRVLGGSFPALEGEVRVEEEGGLFPLRVGRRGRR